MWLTTLLVGVENWAFPPVCVACGGAGAAPSFDLCAGCEGDLPPWPPASSLIAGAPALAGGNGPLDALWSAFAYEFPVDALIRDCKFHGRLAYAAVLGRAAARRWQRLRPFPLQLDGLLPVPLHPSRLRERGFNQAYEMSLPFAHALGLPLLEGVAVRPIATPPQSALDAGQRLQNLRGAFKLRRPVNGMRIAVFDDVLTTGATLAELARVLREAGATQVTGLSVARVP
jgi:ComF family protein